MESSKQEGGRDSLQEIGVVCSSGIARRKTRILRVLVSGPKEMFLIPDALSKYGTFPTVEEFLKEKLRSLVVDYIGRAEEVVMKASEISRPNKSHR